MYERTIVITGMPRSGTSWLSQIIESCPDVRFRLSPFYCGLFRGDVDQNASREQYEAVFRGAYASDDAFMCQSEQRKGGSYPIFDGKAEAPPVLAIKMTRFHNLLRRMLELFDDLICVTMVRHPCGAIHSWLRTPGEFPADANPETEWRSGACRKTAPWEFWGFDDWKEVTRLYLKLQKQYPSQFFILRYEYFVGHAEEEAHRLFEVLRLPYTDITQCFLKASHARHSENSYAVFKDPGVKDKWKDELDPAIQREIISEIENTDLEQFIQ